LLSVAKKLVKIAACILLYLVAFDIVGALVCLFLDIVSFGDSNTAAYYAIWFVLGVFCGLFSYDMGGTVASPKSNADGTNQDWTSREDSGKTGLLVIFTTSMVLVTLSVPCYLFLWQYNPEPSGYVPDSLPLTLTFFGTVLAGSVFAHKALRPEPKKSA
jgi:hypothetical protein